MHEEQLTVRNPLSAGTQNGLKSGTRMLPYRPPFDWTALLDYFRKRAIPGVECVNGTEYRRTFCLDRIKGWFSVQDDPTRKAVRLDVHASDPKCVMSVAGRVRSMLDLDTDPRVLASFFSRDRFLGPAWSSRPGLRVPVAWDPFEFAVRAIAGQRVSVTVASKIMGRIAARFSGPLETADAVGIDRLFPGPARMQGANLQDCGLTRNKACAISTLARAVASGALELEANSSLEEFVAKCTAIRGIGDWTAQTIAMRGLGHPDAFPAGDLGIVKALSTGGSRLRPERVREIAEAWRPWRAYAAMLLWTMGLES
jgi:AraC family transcriptional regulator of adaptative response / DNA-3-methyladenine glycosylase II